MSIRFALTLHPPRKSKETNTFILNEFKNQQSP